MDSEELIGVRMNNDIKNLIESLEIQQSKVDDTIQGILDNLSREYVNASRDKGRYKEYLEKYDKVLDDNVRLQQENKLLREVIDYFIEDETVETLYNKYDTCLDWWLYIANTLGIPRGNI